MKIHQSPYLTIDYNPKFNRVIITSPDGFVSLTQTSWRLIVTLMNYGSKFEQIDINQICSKVGVYYMNNNLTINISGQSHTSQIFLCREAISHIVKNSEIMFAKISSLEMEGKTPSNPCSSLSSVLKKKKCDTDFPLPTPIKKRAKLLPTLRSNDLETKTSTSNSTNTSTGSIVVPPEGLPFDSQPMDLELYNLLPQKPQLE